MSLKGVVFFKHKLSNADFRVRDPKKHAWFPARWSNPQEHMACPGSTPAVDASNYRRVHSLGADLPLKDAADEGLHGFLKEFFFP